MDSRSHPADLIAQFIAHGESETRAERLLDTDEFNRHVVGMKKVVNYIKQQNAGSLEILLPLMNHRDPHVRLYAAYYCLDLDRVRCVSKIRELADSRNMARTMALSILYYIGEGDMRRAATLQSNKLAARRNSVGQRKGS
jgi:hypothetical protein